jgi:hypothetical protein
MTIPSLVPDTALGYVQNKIAYDKIVIYEPFAILESN